uniref:Uncharacterized protein n=1 Tax=Glossina austeni TaxID=7395 RepID=A0A1A9UEG4_GLOAU
MPHKHEPAHLKHMHEGIHRYIFEKQVFSTNNSLSSLQYKKEEHYIQSRTMIFIMKSTWESIERMPLYAQWVGTMSFSSGHFASVCFYVGHVDDIKQMLDHTSVSVYLFAFMTIFIVANIK